MPARQHLVDGGGRPALGHQGGEVAAVAGQPGVLDQEEGVALRAPPQRVGVGRRRLGLGDLGEDLRPPRPRCRAAGAAARACAPAPRRPRRARPWARGCSRQVATTSSRAGLSPATASVSSRSTRRLEVSAQCRSSRTSSSGSLAARRAPCCDHGLPGAERPPSSSARRWTAAPTRAARGPWPRATAPARRRPGSSAPRRWSCRARGVVASSIASRLLPIPGSPVRAAKAGVPSRASARSCSSGRAPRPGRPAARGQDRTLQRRSGGGGAATSRPSLRSGPAQLRVLPQHRGLQVAQLGRHVEAQLLVEHRPQRAQRLERVGLAAAARQRQCPQPPQPLPQGIGRRQGLELSSDPGVLPTGEPDDGPVLERHAAQLFEPGSLGDHRSGIVEIGIGLAAPPRQRVIELAGGLVEPWDESAGRSTSRPARSRR